MKTKINIPCELKLEFSYFQTDIFKHTLLWEGGKKLHKVKGDSGGWTKYGISYNNNFRHFYNLADFKAMTYQEACFLAFTQYYLPAKVNLVKNNCKLKYFDIVFNTGVKRGVKILQSCIGAYPDGIFGIITTSKLPNLTEHCLYKKRNSFYYNLARRNSRLRKFLKGWLNRSKAIFRIGN